jgi:adenylate cyclase
MTEERAQRHLAAILAADVVGYSRLMEQDEAEFTPEGVEQAGQIWEEGLAKFPNSALLQVNLGWYHMGRAYNGFSNDPTSDFRKAGELVRQALAHPNLSPLERRLCHWLFAYVNLWERMTRR